MVPVKIKIFQTEVEAWMRLLKLLQAENVELKHRLAQVISNGISQDLLPVLERYHNFFIEEDRVLLLFYHDVKNQQQLLQRYNLKKKIAENQVLHQQEKIRQEIALVETVFYKKQQGFKKLVATLA